MNDVQAAESLPDFCFDTAPRGDRCDNCGSCAHADLRFVNLPRAGTLRRPHAVRRLHGGGPRSAADLNGVRQYLRCDRLNGAKSSATLPTTASGAQLSLVAAMPRVRRAGPDGCLQVVGVVQVVDLKGCVLDLKAVVERLL